ncbi:DUF4255 domain-containing protein [Deminuibacter soli]|uniref:DUF4255 domain-containing protein n=1 Tax=Deminuibacter soli TaxID=2291815 RepID=A0A3E1NG40_9BACT|nr:DUF4255 domain-containing protein [Deminuibacter soli]RFM26933.1 DUF4255 domain-containing protein [Deminuibacter soli]
MSTALAIAAVTHVMKDLLNNGFVDNDVSGAIGGNFALTAIPPDRIDTSVANEQTQLNLFMYQATVNQGWRNEGLPTHDSAGTRVSNPPLALDLHYLISAYSATELLPEILMGFAMLILHDTPVLSRDIIKQALQPPLDVNLPMLALTELAEQTELIKISPVVLSTEEISKLWPAFQAKYRATAAYKVTVVLLQSRKSKKSALPVRSRQLYVVPFHQPVIESIASKSAPAAPVVDNQQILAGYILVLKGHKLSSDQVTVNIDGIVATPAPADISDEQISIAIPAAVTAGVHTAQVVQPQLMGVPPVAHKGAVSNVQAFVLSPSIVSVTAANVTGTGTAPRAADIAVKVNPLVANTQQVELLLNEWVAVTGTTPLAAYSFTLSAATLAAGPATTDTVTIPVTGVTAGTYLVRIRINGAESPLAADSAGRYNAPTVVIP